MERWLNLTAEGPARALVQCTALKSPETGRWIGECTPLAIAVEADNLEELYDIFGETVQLLIADLIEEGDLEEFLRARGWAEENLPSTLRDRESAAPSVPWELVAHG